MMDATAELIGSIIQFHHHAQVANALLDCAILTMTLLPMLTLTALTQNANLTAMTATIQYFQELRILHAMELIMTAMA